jgi:uncharacterized protein YlaI
MCDLQHKCRWRVDFLDYDNLRRMRLRLREIRSNVWEWFAQCDALDRLQAGTRQQPLYRKLANKPIKSMQQDATERFNIKMSFLWLSMKYLNIIKSPKNKIWWYAWVVTKFDTMDTFQGASSKKIAGNAWALLTIE